MAEQNPQDEALREAQRIHAPVIDCMENMGYALLKDGETFYKLGYELAPRDHTTFTITQAYEIHEALKATNRSIERARLEARLDECDIILKFPPNTLKQFKEAIKARKSYLKRSLK